MLKSWAMPPGEAGPPPQIWDWRSCARSEDARILRDLRWIPTAMERPGQPRTAEDGLMRAATAVHGHDAEEFLRRGADGGEGDGPSRYAHRASTALGRQRKSLVKLRFAASSATGAPCLASDIATIRGRPDRRPR